MNSKLTAEQRIARNREIVRQYREGITTKQIAERHGLTPGRIVQILNAAGVEMK